MKNGHHYIASHISFKHKKDAAYRKDQSKLLEDGDDGDDLETIETPSKKAKKSGIKKEEDDLVKKVDLMKAGKVYVKNGSGPPAKRETALRC
ncbi:hypothetical protein PG997_010738 [Apiospora hydei]|uniref:Uncharacterized protein n=1 Tax=Apiospora hydei TaxID=1337664 RepID=A0ABR1VJY8_9PEZI